MMLLCTESGSLGLEEEEECLSGRHLLRILAWSGKGKAGPPVTPRDPCSDRRLNLEHTPSSMAETSPYLVKTRQGGFLAMNPELRLKERSLLKVRSQ